MERFNIDYAVIILNYNTAEDAIYAAKSVVYNSIKYSYVICLVDNNSSKEGEFPKLQNAKVRNTLFLDLKTNGGYARGNNEGIRYVLSKYNPRHIVIMNPDVEIVEAGTIDRLIARLDELPETFCGIQPIVWTPGINLPKEYQTSIRKLMTYSDCIIEHFFLFKRIFRSNSYNYVYRNERPYTAEITFEVPSGAFFIVRAQDFIDIGLFDERTFLYCEESIIGAKMDLIGKKFLFLPSEYVQHEGGKSIGSNFKRLKWKAVKCGMQSNEVYLKNYLHCNAIQIWLIKFIITIDFICKKFSYMFRPK